MFHISCLFLAFTVIDLRDGHFDIRRGSTLSIGLYLDHLRLWKRAVTSRREFDVTGDRHGFAVLELLALGKLGLERLIKRHGLAREFLESQEHLLVEWKLRLGFLAIFSLAEAHNDALFALSFPFGLDIEFTCALALTTGLNLGKLIVAEVKVVALECDRFGNLV